MEVINLSLLGLKLIKPKVIRDKRGFFTETYRENLYQEKGIKNSKFVQDNHSFSYKNTIRGMHFQTSPGQDKLVSVAYGKIFDVAVDIRKDSKTFGQWEGVILDDENCFQFFIPKGFAHGFCVLSEKAHVIYKVSNYFDPQTEGGFSYKDPQVKIKWPVEKPILSKKDEEAPFLEEINL